MSSASVVASQLKKALGPLAVVAAVKAIETAKPHAEKWWNDNALPFIESNVDTALNKALKSRKPGH